MGQYTEADERFVSSIKQSLEQRQIINANKLAGVMPMQAEPDDRMSTELTITRDQFRSSTNRTKVREAAWEKLIGGFENDPSGWMKVKRGAGAAAFTITFSPPVSAEGRFNGLEALQDKNAQDIAEDPDLTAPYWE